jgi:hypothetical protein
MVHTGQRVGCITALGTALCTRFTSHDILLAHWLSIGCRLMSFSGSGAVPALQVASCGSAALFGKLPNSRLGLANLGHQHAEGLQRVAAAICRLRLCPRPITM